MKKLVFVCLLVSAMNSTGYASLIAEDLFDYDVSINNDGYPLDAGDTSLVGLNGGSGWAGEWTGTTNAPYYPTIVEPVMSYPGMTLTGNSLYTWGSYGASTNNYRTGAYRELAGPVGGNAGDVLWVGFLVRAEGDPSGQQWAGVSLFYNDGGTLREKLLIGAPSDSYPNSTPPATHVQHWGFTSYITGSANNQLSDVSITEQAFFVTRLEFTGSEVTVTSWLNPALGSVPDEGNAVLQQTYTGTFTATHVRIASKNMTEMNWDELRLGTTYADVVPEPATLLLLSLGSLTLYRRRQ
ncbi:MAG: PEP-CTERM sorting domain-containing protein [Sedimentisphaerales bacterium]|nr:PEP-CTERM sorting domain-containing protein [Sedimentisphaerales bacterium]